MVNLLLFTAVYQEKIEELFIKLLLIVQ